MLATYTDKEALEWDRYLPLVTFAYNTGIQSSTKQSPFFLIRLREARLPTDMAMTIEPGNLYESTTLYAQEMSVAIRQAWSIAREALEKAQDKQKDYADQYRRSKEHDIQEQDLVLVQRGQSSRNECVKLMDRWDGPYRVLRLERPNVVVRQLHEDAHPKKVHLDRVKKYHKATTLPLHKMDGADNAQEYQEYASSEEDESPPAQETPTTEETDEQNHAS